jgi:hypothetical protein
MGAGVPSIGRPAIADKANPGCAVVLTAPLERPRRYFGLVRLIRSHGRRLGLPDKQQFAWMTHGQMTRCRVGHVTGLTLSHLCWTFRG